jgi:hypothetical protein
MVDVDEKVHQVKYKICSKIEGKEKLLAPKLDNLWKHGGRRKPLTNIQGVYKACEYYMNKYLVHTKNEWLYTIIRKDLLLIRFPMLLLVRGKKSRFNFLFVFICCLKVDP